MGGSKTYPYGSTGAVRAHVLAALGVLKVASADQIRRLMCPGHKDNKAVRNACLDLAKHGLVVSEGTARDASKLWGLTPLGLDAAAEVLSRPPGEMGGTARGAARSGAPHAMAVNETVIAITRTLPEPTRPVRRSGTAPVTPPHETAAREPAGIGTPASWSTEVVHVLSGGTRGRSTVQADAVLLAPDAGVPVLLVEVDNCTESAERLAGKFDRYRDYFRRTVKDARGGDVPAWRSLYPPTGRQGHPPVVVVFNPGSRAGQEALKNRMNRVLDLTRDVWSGRYENMGSTLGKRDGYQDYTDAVPLVFTTLPRLQADGPLEPVWWRCGHRQWETLADALDNPDGIEAWQVRDEALQRRQQQEWKRREQERQEREQEHGWGTVRAAPVPTPAPAVEPPVPCARCAQPVTGPEGLRFDDAPPEDGRHCPECRIDIARQPPGAFKALFGRRPPA
ncbi:replication-relaxation family protein [Streptomyces sp. NPDC090106]|uniref:replication-relaxation family protein n=1 Tax=Streptomyces sp. NPDC090106 TaxID=3365946 RepID=UPI003812EA6D